jgi:hypothetical protein
MGTIASILLLPLWFEDWGLHSLDYRKSATSGMTFTTEADIGKGRLHVR